LADRKTSTLCGALLTLHGSSLVAKCIFVVPGW
jgi:hypothetical protein